MNGTLRLHPRLAKRIRNLFLREELLRGTSWAPRALNAQHGQVALFWNANQYQPHHRQLKESIPIVSSLEIVI